MASLLSSSPSNIRLPPLACYTYNPLPPLKPNLQQCHSRQKGFITIQQKRRPNSLIPLCVEKPNGAEQTHDPDQMERAVRDFYLALNKKDLQRFHKLIADECIFEDLAFSKPFKGKKVHEFLKDLTEAMGKDVQFIVDNVYKGKELRIAVMWHLEWQKKRIPFATGCSFFEFLTNGKGFLIKKAIVYFESPLKPGDFVLELLKIISSLFDNFPKQAKWFLEKPMAVIQFVVKMYKILVEPLILPLIVYYTHLWTFAARLLSFFLNLLQKLLKFFM